MTNKYSASISMRKDYVQLIPSQMVVRLKSEKPTSIAQYVCLNKKGEATPQHRRSKNTIGQCVKTSDKHGNIFIVTCSMLAVK